MTLFLINHDNQEMEMAMISPGKTIHYMKKKTVRAQKVKMFSPHLISTGRCRDWEGGREKATQVTNTSSIKDWHTFCQGSSGCCCMFPE